MYTLFGGGTPFEFGNDWDMFKMHCCDPLMDATQKFICTDQTTNISREICLRYEQSFFYAIYLLDVSFRRCEYKIRISVGHRDLPRSFPIVFKNIFASKNVSGFKVAADVGSKEYVRISPADQHRFRDSAQYTIYLLGTPIIPDIAFTTSLVVGINSDLNEAGISVGVIPDSDITILSPYMSGRYVPEYDVMQTRVSGAMAATDRASDGPHSRTFKDFVDQIHKEMEKQRVHSPHQKR